LLQGKEKKLIISIYLFYFLFIFSLFLSISWEYALLFFLLSLIFSYGVFWLNKKIEHNELKAKANLSYRIKKAGVDLLNNIPIGIIVYNEEKKIEWTNNYLKTLLDNLNLSKKIDELFVTLKDKEKVPFELRLKDKVIQVEHHPQERIIYFFDITTVKYYKEKAENQRIVLGLINYDNVEEVVQGMVELDRNLLLSKVTSTLTEWAQENNLFLRRISSDKFIFITYTNRLKVLEENRFNILDRVREITIGNKIPLTLSIGIGSGSESLIELGNFAQSALDIALGRGGDQAAIKHGEYLSFYGGKTNAVEKRTRVRARVISHAIRDLILQSDQVFIMGHVQPDIDALASAIGVLKMVELNKKTGYIMFTEVNPSIEMMINYINQNLPELLNKFLHPEKAAHMLTGRTLLVIVDTHRPSMVLDEKLLSKAQKIIVIDHHRRSEEFIHDPILVYIEPYASSTSELITELLDYQGEKLNLNEIEATLLLAGIVVDTKSFAYRTGSRTFEAASYLRKLGADPIQVQQMLKESLEKYLQRQEIIKYTKIYYDSIAIAKVPEVQVYDQVLIAKAADTLLNIAGVKASFVISKRADKLINISGRSLGEVNVQVILEKMGGGGHLNNAAVQLTNATVDEAHEQLLRILKDIIR